MSLYGAFLSKKYIIEYSQCSSCHKNLPFNCQKRMEKNKNRGIISIFMCKFYFNDLKVVLQFPHISFWSGWLSVYIRSGSIQVKKQSTLPSPAHNKKTVGYFWGSLSVEKSPQSLKILETFITRFM